MKNVILLSIAMALCACSTVPRVAPRFDTPSTKPIQQSTTKAVSHVQAAQQKAKVIEAAEKDPAIKLQIDSLQVDLGNALTELNTSKGEIAQLDTQLQQQTTKANSLADSFDRSSAQLTSLAASRHRWVKYFWYSTGLLALAGVWIFRKPLLMLASGL